MDLQRFGNSTRKQTVKLMARLHILQKFLLGKCLYSWLTILAGCDCFIVLIIMFMCHKLNNTQAMKINV